MTSGGVVEEGLAGGGEAKREEENTIDREVD